MKDIAREAGVSQSTVSRILSDVPMTVPVGRQTRARVLEAARRLGFTPNPMARALRGAPTMLVGAIVRDLTDPFFGSAIEALAAEARLLGYNIVLGSAHGSAEEALELAAILEARQCDALLLLGDVSDQPRLIADLRRSHVPVVALWQGSTRHGLASVNVDNAWGVRLALEHLASLGHRRIAFLAGRGLGDIRERSLTFVRWMRARRLEVPAGYVQHGPNLPAGGDAALRALLDLPEPPTALVTSTDVLALGVLHAASERGLRVPADLSVVGFDDIALAAHFVPALTTLRMPTREMVKAAMEMAIRARQSPDQPAGDTTVFRPELIVRGSTGPPREERSSPSHDTSSWGVDHGIRGT